MRPFLSIEKMSVGYGTTTVLDKLDLGIHKGEFVALLGSSGCGKTTLLLYTASSGGNYQIASITALLLLVPSIGFMLVVERFLRADVLSKVGH